MMVLLFLLIASLFGVVAAFIVPGWSDLLLLAGPCAFASLILLVRAAYLWVGSRRRIGKKWIVIDGSNVMYWKDGTPQIETVREVVRHFSSRGFETGVMFDANAGHLLFGKYQHDEYFGKVLNLPKNRVMVVPKGNPADRYILNAARDLGARIVTNDRFRDWADGHPEIRTPGHLIRGNYRSGQLWLDLGSNGEQKPATSSTV